MSQRFARFKRDNTKYGKRHIPGVMNQTESAYADALYALKLTGEIIDWKFEAVKFRLAAGCFYTPDFAVFYADCEMEFVDVKGGGPIAEASVVRMKCAAEAFPFFRFAMEQRLPKKGGWKRTEY